MTRIISTLLPLLLPQHLSHWGHAMQAEIASVTTPAESRRLALECLLAVIRIGSGPICAIAATLLGCLYLALAGAPTTYLILNLASCLLGLLLYTALRRRTLTLWPLLVLALSLPATALLGRTISGASRWVMLAGIPLEVSMVALPLLLLYWRTAQLPLAIAALGLALQPDRAMSGVLALSLLTLSVIHRRHLALTTLALLCFAYTLTRPDTLAPAPFVEGIIPAAFHLHPALGLTILGGLLILLVPLRHNPLFGLIWGGIIVASLLGNYPTPVLGFGGSAILGYCLSLAALSPAPTPHPHSIPSSTTSPDSGSHTTMRCRLVSAT